VRILVVAATDAELAAAPPSADGVTFDPLVTGVGMVATAARVSAALTASRYDAALDIGICGAFDRTLALATVVHVTSEALPELGAEDGEAFLSLADLGLTGADAPLWTNGRLVNTTPPAWPGLATLPRVSGLTVNTTHGHEASVAAVLRRYPAQVESMEGAAFFYSCFTAGVPCAQVRAISNYVERRNRAAWRVPEALDALRLAAAGLWS
jgi:futalosine hydrolase